MADRDTENSKRKRGGATSPRLPPLVPQQSTGGLFGCLKATIKFRFIAYIIAQPPNCLFLLGLSLLAFCLLPLGAYVTYNTLPNFDVMLKWNAPLGILPSTSFCADESNSTHTPPSCIRAACVLIPFKVPRSVIVDNCSHTLQAVVDGSTLKSRNERHKLVRNDIYVIVEIPIANESATSYCSPESVVSLFAMVTYCTVDNSTAQELGITEKAFNDDWESSAKDVSSTTRPCNTSRFDTLSHNVTFRSVHCAADKRVTPEAELFRHRGLVNLFLTEEERALAASRLYITSVIVFIATVVCAVVICLTDRPPKPKQEGTAD